MKKIFGLLVAVNFISFSYSQVWFDLGIKGGVGTSFMLNKTIGSDSRIDIFPGFNNFFGGKVGINFGEQHAVTLDVNHSKNKVTFLQNALPDQSSATSYKYDINYTALNIAPLYRFTNEASYLEVGPQFSIVKNQFGADEYSTLTDIDLTDRVTSNITGILFGFGGYIVGNERIALLMGLRFHYTITNLTSDMYANTRFPFNNYNDITGGNSTNLIIPQIHLELNYSLGYFVRSSCGRRVSFLSF